MHLTVFDTVFWITGYLGSVCLMTVMIIKKRYRELPWFTALLAGELLQSVVLVLVHVYGSHKGYFYTYWSCEVVEATLRVAVLAELTGIILMRVNRRDAPFLKEFVLTGCELLLLAAVAVWRFTPDFQVFLTNVAFKITVLSGVILMGLASVTFFTVFFYGVRFRVHVAVLTYGLIVYSAGKFAVFALVFTHGSSYWWRVCEQTLKPLYVLCLCIWSVSLWFEEPVRKVSLEMQKIITSSQHLSSKRFRHINLPNGF